MLYQTDRCARLESHGRASALYTYLLTSLRFDVPRSADEVRISWTSIDISSRAPSASWTSLRFESMTYGHACIAIKYGSMLDRSVPRARDRHPILVEEHAAVRSVNVGDVERGPKRGIG